MKDKFIELGVALVKVVLGVAAGLVGLFLWMTLVMGQRPQPVTYRVSGSARSALITYTNDQGGSEQQTVSLPWSLDMHVTKGTTLQITAQSQDEDGDVVVDIDGDGQNLKESQSSGGYAVASASDVL